MPQPTDETAEEYKGLSVVDKVLDAFYHTLEKNPEFVEIAARLKKEKNYSEASISRALFGNAEE